MSNPEQPRLYRADFNCILGKGVPGFDPLGFIESNVEEYGDFRAVVGLMRAVESYRDYATFSPALPPSEDIDEIIKYAYYSFGYKDESLKPVICASRHTEPAVTACNTAEALFVDCVRKIGNSNILNGIVYLTNEGQPILFQKGLKEKTALGLGVISVEGVGGSVVNYPAGWIYELKFDIDSGSGDRITDYYAAIVRLRRGETVLSKQPVQSVTSLRPIRPSAFSMQTPKGIAMARGYNGLDVDLDKHSVAWFVGKLSSGFVSPSD